MTAAGPGPLNLITDVPGVRVGQAMDAAVRTGVTVILTEERAVCAVDVRGGGPGARETDILAADTLVEAISVRRRERLHEQLTIVRSEHPVGRGR